MNLRISTAPHIRHGATTQMLMAQVLIALLPCVVAGVYRFGTSAALLLVVSSLSAVVFEYLCLKLTKKDGSAAGDLSALVTGLLLGLNLPARAPWWIAVIGSAFAILLVKQLFGGVGDNFVNPALAARAMLLASWPVHMASFIQPVNGLVGSADALSGATPLVMPTVANMDLFLGNIGGSIGEVSKLMILLGLVYLLAAKVISWRIPVAMLASTALFSWIFGGDPLRAVLMGGVMFGAVFMATDYTTSPMTAKGQLVYAAGAGLIVAAIRKYGMYPEGVTYAILLMNIATPLIDKYMKPRLYGRLEKQKEVRANA